MTSPSEFVDGERIWDSYVYWSDGRPVVSIRRGVAAHSPQGSLLIALDDGRVEFVWPEPSSARRIFRTYVEAVACAVERICAMRNRCDEAIQELLEMDEQGDPATASISAAGVAPPEVAT